MGKIEYWSESNKCWMVQPIAIMETKRYKKYSIEELPNLGWITITEIGEENVYFTLSNDENGFYKI